MSTYDIDSTYETSTYEIHSTYEVGGRRTGMAAAVRAQEQNRMMGTLTLTVNQRYYTAWVY